MVRQTRRLHGAKTLGRGHVFHLRTMDQLSVRPFQESDRGALLRTLESSRDFPDELLNLYRRPAVHYETLVAWSRGAIVGMLTGSYDSDFAESGAFESFDPPRAPHAFLVRVHVHEVARGHGVGRALVGSYVGEAVSRGCSFVGGQVDLSSDSTARRAFFENLGFSIRALDNFGALPSQLSL